MSYRFPPPVLRRPAGRVISSICFVGLGLGLSACGDDGPSTPTEPPATDVTESGPTSTAPGDSGAAAEGPTVEEAADVLVGLSEEEAEAAATEQGWAFRVVRRDGEDLPTTMDLRPDRVNVEVTDGDVIAVVSIG